MTRKFMMSVCCVAAAAVFLVQSAAVESTAFFGSSIPDTEDIDVVIDVDSSRKSISKYIYGLNSVYDISGVDVNSTKQAGAFLSSYNWETNYSNSAKDGGFINSSDLVSNYSQNRWSTPALYTTSFVNSTKLQGIHSKYVTLQMMGRVANDSFGVVSSNDSAQRWASVRFNKNDSLLIQPELHDDTVYMDEYVSYLVNTYGYAADGGVNGYFLDSEPEKWDENYTVLGLEPITAEELLSKSVSLATTVKKIDPTALVYGPSINGLEAYVNLQNPEDWERYNSDYSWFIDYYLTKMKAASDQAGVRLLDVLDLHFISEANSVVIEPIITTDSIFANAERVQAVRALWDSTYTENSQSAVLYKQHTPIIPTAQASIRMYYPDTRLSFSEYNFGGGSNISGGIAQADVLGVFSEQEVYMACLLPNSENYEYQKAGINIYTNYDGEGSTYGNVAVYADNGGDVMSSVYASVMEGDDSALKAVFINKNEYDEKTAYVNINSDVTYNSARIFSFNEDSSEITLTDTIDEIENNTFSYVMDPMTVYLFEFDGSSIITEIIDPDDPQEPEETTVTTEEIPEHVEVSGDSFTTSEHTRPTEQITETVTSISIVGTDAEGETITSIVSDTAVVEGSTTEITEAVGDESEPVEEEENEKSVPSAVKVIAIILVVAVMGVMVYVLVTDNKTTPTERH